MISSIAVTTLVSLNNKGACHFIKGIFKLEQSVYLFWDQKSTFKLQKHMVLLTLLTKGDLNCNDFFPKKWKNIVDCS